MAKISVDIDEQLRNQFKNLAKKKFGKKKNFLALALNEAIGKWISEFKIPTKTIDDYSNLKDYNQKSIESVVDRSFSLVLESKEQDLNNYQNKNEKLVYTIGYQKKTLDVFIELLKKKDIKTLVDIRRNIKSQKENFSGTELDFILRQNQILYVSLPMLGPPSEMRYELYENKNYPVFFDKFRKYLNNNINYLEKINKLPFPICLLCYEDKASECHRSIVAEKLLELNKNWIVEHIELAKKEKKSEKDLTSFGTNTNTQDNQISAYV